MKKIALITGASSSVGKATALKLAKAGYDLLLAGNRLDKLKEIEEQIKSKYTTKVLIRNFDIRVYQEVEDSLRNTLPIEWNQIEVLINCAGMSLHFEPIYKGVIEDWDNMIDTNIKGLLYVSRIITSGMVERKLGHIINIGSTITQGESTNVNAYSSIKYVVDGISKNMRIDLQPYGILVTQILPDKIINEFSMASLDKDKKTVRKNNEEFISLNAQDVADAIIYTLFQPSHVNIENVLISPKV